VEKQLSDGVDSIDKLQLPSNLSYKTINKFTGIINGIYDVKEDNDVLTEEQLLYFERQCKILLWLLYQEGVVHVKNIHILIPYYWSRTYDFFKYATTPYEEIEYKCRVIVDAIIQHSRQ
ncbi:chromatin remodeling protein, putative, partial [Hepatocystis sp. ex Piliocolobus tephrosceles]